MFAMFRIFFATIASGLMSLHNSFTAGEVASEGLIIMAEDMKYNLLIDRQINMAQRRNEQQQKAEALGITLEEVTIVSRLAKPKE